MKYHDVIATVGKVLLEGGCWIPYALSRAAEAPQGLVEAALGVLEELALVRPVPPPGKGARRTEREWTANALALQAKLPQLVARFTRKPDTPLPVVSSLSPGSGRSASIVVSRTLSHDL